MINPRSLSITGTDGIALHATRWPGGERPVCILLHGFGHDSRVWDPLALALQPNFEVVALDFRGHGKSAWDEASRYCHNTLLDDLHRLVENLPAQQFHLLGHSLGARVAMLYAAANPQRVISLTIMDTGPEVGDKGANRIREDAQSMPTHFDNQRAYFDWLCQRHPLATRESLERMAEHGLRPVNGRWQPRTDPQFANSLWHQDAAGNGARDLRHPLTQELWGCLDHITCETLVLRGQISSILKLDVAQEMAEQRLARGRLASVPMAGHAIMLDNPGYCIEVIEGFLSGNCNRQGLQSNG